LINLFAVNETLDGVLEGSDDEQQSDAIVNQVLDEIGIEISGKVRKLFILFYSSFMDKAVHVLLFFYLFQMLNAPTPSKGAISSKQKDKGDMVSDAEIQEMLAKLNS